eukprot:507802-Pelagomonas_calceolata.AAC.1
MRRWQQRAAGIILVLPLSRLQAWEHNGQSSCQGVTGTNTSLQKIHCDSPCHLWIVLPPLLACDSSCSSIARRAIGLNLGIQESINSFGREIAVCIQYQNLVLKPIHRNVESMSLSTT